MQDVCIMPKFPDIEFGEHGGLDPVFPGEGWVGWPLYGPPIVPFPSDNDPLYNLASDVHEPEDRSGPLYGGDGSVIAHWQVSDLGWGFGPHFHCPYSNPLADLRVGRFAIVPGAQSDHVAQINVVAVAEKTLRQSLCHHWDYSERYGVQLYYPHYNAEYNSPPCCLNKHRISRYDNIENAESLPTFYVHPQFFSGMTGRFKVAFHPLKYGIHAPHCERGYAWETLPYTDSAGRNLACKWACCAEHQQTPYCRQFNMNELSLRQEAFEGILNNEEVLHWAETRELKFYWSQLSILMYGSFENRILPFPYPFFEALLAIAGINGCLE